MGDLAREIPPKWWLCWLTVNIHGKVFLPSKTHRYAHTERKAKDQKKKKKVGDLGRFHQIGGCVDWTSVLKLNKIKKKKKNRERAKIYTCVDIADIRMAVTLAGYAASKGATIHHIATETRSARLAELANVALWTRALFYPECIWALVEALPRCAKLDVVNETNTCSTTKKLYFFVVLKKKK